MEQINVHFHSLANEKLASHRLRVQLPHDIIRLNHPLVVSIISSGFVRGTDIVVFNKHFDPEGMSRLLFEYKQIGTKTIYDVCDDHFDKPVGKFYEWMCKNVDKITCPSPRMQERIYEVTGKLAQIIPDPVTFPQRSPRQFSDGHKCLWFGHASNLPALKESGWLDYLTHQGVPLTVCTNVPFVYPNVGYLKWDVGVVENQIQHYDTVILPVLKTPEAKNKSLNRAIDALSSGCNVITNSKQVYGELKDFICIIKDLHSSALGLGKETPEEIKKRVEKGQEYVSSRYSPENVTSLWVKVFRQVKDQQPEEMYA